LFNREKILDTVTGSGEKEVVARGLDIAQGVLCDYTPQLSDFYDPFHTALLTSILGGIPGLLVGSDGGYPGAERRRLLVCPDYLDPQAESYGLAFLIIQGKSGLSRVTHRDFLGSLLGLGLRREKMGDIIVDQSRAQVILDEEISDFVRVNLSKVGRNTVKVKEVGRQDINPPVPDIKEIRSTVPSMRLDVVAAGAFGVSRSKMVREVNAGKVAVNWRLFTDQSAPVKEGDMISVRGKGRAKVAEVGGRTKKGRIAITLHRYV